MELGFLFTLGVDTEQSVLDIRAVAMASLLAGSTIVEFNSEGTSYTKNFSLPPDQIIAECNYFLKTNFPCKYGRRVTRTRPYFY